MTSMTSSARPVRPVGELLREWRERRRMSQLDLSIQADISTRHLSFVETGRSRPTPAMIIRLTEQLDVPLRERNTLLLAAGYAPAYPQHGLDEPALCSVRAALRQVLAGHEPYPAVIINRWWEMLDANQGIDLLIEGCAPALLEPPVNVLRLSLHPDGMAPRIRNLGQWRAHLLTQLQHRCRALGDQRLAELHRELLGYPGGSAAAPQLAPAGVAARAGVARAGVARAGVARAGVARAGAVAGEDAAAGVVLPLRYRHGDTELSLFSISASVGTATDVTVDELAIEAFYPADEATASALRSPRIRSGSRLPG